MRGQDWSPHGTITIGATAWVHAGQQIVARPRTARAVLVSTLLRRRTAVPGSTPAGPAVYRCEVRLPSRKCERRTTQVNLAHGWHRRHARTFNAAKPACNSAASGCDAPRLAPRPALLALLAAATARTWSRCAVNARSCTHSGAFLVSTACDPSSRRQPQSAPSWPLACTRAPPQAPLASPQCAAWPAPRSDGAPRLETWQR